MYNRTATTQISRSNLYKKVDDKFVFVNPAFDDSMRNADSGAQGGYTMDLKDFLASMPIFSNCSDQQLSILENNARLKLFKAQDVIFRQGDDGDVFYIIHKGAVDVLIQVIYDIFQ